jgi:hypothetical protein
MGHSEYTNGSTFTAPPTGISQPDDVFAGNRSNLTAADLAMFARLRIPTGLLLKARVQRVTDQEAKDPFGILGTGNSGIVYPYYIDDGRVGARVRRDHGEPKYRSAYGDRKHLYFLPGVLDALLAEPTLPVVLVESEKAALAGSAYMERTGARLVFVGLGGCWGWSGRIGKAEAPDGARVDVNGPLPDLAACDKRTVYVMLDSNVAINPKVQQAERKLVMELRKRECKVLICRIPRLPDVNGSDDLLAVGGDDALTQVIANASDALEDAEPWPEPESLGVALPEVPEFDAELLPAALRPLAEDTAHRMQVPLDFCAVALVVALAGVCNRRAFIRPKRRDPWTVVPNLWGMIVASPGQLKSPTVAAVMKPLWRIQCRWKEEFDAGQQRHEQATEAAELKLSAWKQQATAAYKAGKVAPERPSEQLVKPSEKRLLTSDCTFEKLHSLLAENPAGMFLLRDELSGWLSSFERRGREDERAFYLECWNGDSPFRMDRVGRGSIYVEACCISLFGGIQPARLRSYLRDALEDGPTNDGLIQRLQLAIWPEPCQTWTYTDSTQNEQATRYAEQVFERVASLDADNPRIYRFDRDAQELFMRWLSDLEQTIRDKDLSPIMVSHLSKYRSLMPSLALLFALADDVQGEEIPLRYAQQAAAFCDYLRPHAERIYACKLAPEVLAAIDLSQKLAEGWKREVGQFALRELYRRHWAGLGTPDEAESALAVLEDAGWVRKAESSSPTSGRPSSEIFLINPRIYGGEK